MKRSLVIVNLFLVVGLGYSNFELQQQNQGLERKAACLESRVEMDSFKIKYLELRLCMAEPSIDRQGLTANTPGSARY